MRLLALALLMAGCGGGGGGGSTPDGPPGGTPDGATSDGATPDAAAPSPDATPAPWPGCVACDCTSTNLVPLTELGAGTYMGVEGGLYPGGSNDRPAAHETAGLAPTKESISLRPK